MSDAVAIGQQLLAARERLGLSVAQAAESLRVDAAVITALEEGRFLALGAPVFVRGYLRHYAAMLGEPIDEVTGRYKTLHESGASPDLTDARLMAPRATGAACSRWPLVVLAVVLVVAALVWWALGVKKI